MRRGPGTGSGVGPEPLLAGAEGKVAGSGARAYSVMRLASSVQAAVELAEKTRYPVRAAFMAGEAAGRARGTRRAEHADSGGSSSSFLGILRPEDGGYGSPRGDADGGDRRGHGGTRRDTPLPPLRPDGSQAAPEPQPQPSAAASSGPRPSATPSRAARASAPPPSRKRAGRRASPRNSVPTRAPLTRVLSRFLSLSGQAFLTSLFGEGRLRLVVFPGVFQFTARS